MRTAAPWSHLKPPWPSCPSCLEGWTVESIHLPPCTSCRLRDALAVPLDAHLQLLNVTFSVSTRYFLWESMSCSTVPSPGRGASKSSVTQPSYLRSRRTRNTAGKSTPPDPRRL